MVLWGRFGTTAALEFHGGIEDHGVCPPAYWIKKLGGSEAGLSAVLVLWVCGVVSA